MVYQQGSNGLSTWCCTHFQPVGSSSATRCQWAGNGLVTCSQWDCPCLLATHSQLPLMCVGELSFFDAMVADVVWELPPSCHAHWCVWSFPLSLCPMCKPHTRATVPSSALMHIDVVQELPSSHHEHWLTPGCSGKAWGLLEANTIGEKYSSGAARTGVGVEPVTDKSATREGVYNSNWQQTGIPLNTRLCSPPPPSSIAG